MLESRGIEGSLSRRGITLIMRYIKEIINGIEMYGRTTDGKRARPRTSQLQISRLPLLPRLCNGNTNLVTSRIGLIWLPHGGGRVWPLPRDHRSVCEERGANQRPRHKQPLISMWSSRTSHNSRHLSTEFIRRRPWQVMWH